uniref:Uncharacterized protein n=1 Tax=Rhizophora mucronata TaxID=61149 RepID=A0A2P2N1Q0_RHIMU
MKGRSSDNFVMPMTVVNPPLVQEVTAANENQESRTSETGNDLEVQTL